MDRTTLRRAQMELDSNIANLARQLVSREDRLGPLISLEVQVTTLSQSRINRLISVGKILTWLLPMSIPPHNISFAAVMALLYFICPFIGCAFVSDR